MGTNIALSKFKYDVLDNGWRVTLSLKAALAYSSHDLIASTLMAECQ